MRISKNEKIGNIPILEIRGFFREYNRGFILESIMNHFHIEQKEAESLIEILKNNKYIDLKTEEHFLAIGDYILDDKGYALCAAKSIPPINREKADKIYADFMQRVKEINNSDYFLLKVEKLYLFGSYLDKEKNDYGDIDIGYKLKRKESNYDKYTLLRKQRINEMQKKGRYFQTFDEELYFPEKEVMLKLKNKCRYISLQPIEDDFFCKIKYIKIYPIKNTNS